MTLEEAKELTQKLIKVTHYNFTDKKENVKD